jgi:hypothetical protein
MGVDEREVPIYAGWADSMVSIADVVGLPIVSLNTSLPCSRLTQPQAC